jgi:hypothetical protein
MCHLDAALWQFTKNAAASARTAGIQGSFRWSLMGVCAKSASAVSDRSHKQLTHGHRAAAQRGCGCVACLPGVQPRCPVQRTNSTQGHPSDSDRQSTSHNPMLHAFMYCIHPAKADGVGNVRRGEPRIRQALIPWPARTVRARFLVRSSGDTALVRPCFSLWGLKVCIGQGRVSTCIVRSLLCCEE